MQPKDTNPRNMARDQRRRLARRNARQGQRPLTPFFLFALAVGLGIPAHAATDSYTGADGGAYNVAANWNNGTGPAPGIGNNDDGVNSTANAINFNTNATINSFSSTGDAAFNVQSGTLAGFQANAASLFASNGTITAVNSTLSNLTVNGALTVNNNVTLTNVVLEGTPSLSPANLTDYTVGQVTLGGGTAMTAAAATLGGGTLDLGSDNNNATLTVAAGSALSGSGLIQNNYNNTDTIVNNGTLDANVSGATLQLNQSSTTNNGTAEATNGGTLLFNDNVTDTGTLLAATGSAVNFQNATLTGTGTGLLLSAQGTGTLSAVNETLTGSFVTSGAGLTLNNNVTLSGFTLGGGKISLSPANLTDYTVGQVTLGGGTAMTAATATLGGGTLDLGSDNNNATLTVAAGSALSGSGLIQNNYDNTDTSSTTEPSTPTSAGPPSS